MKIKDLIVPALVGSGFVAFSLGFVYCIALLTQYYNPHM